MTTENTQYYAILIPQSEKNLEKPSAFAGAYFESDENGNPLIFSSHDSAFQYQDSNQIDGMCVEIPID